MNLIFLLIWSPSLIFYRTLARPLNSKPESYYIYIYIYAQRTYIWYVCIYILAWCHLSVAACKTAASGHIERHANRISVTRPAGASQPFSYIYICIRTCIYYIIIMENTFRFSFIFFLFLSLFCPRIYIIYCITVKPQWGRVFTIILYIAPGHSPVLRETCQLQFAQTLMIFIIIIFASYPHTKYSATQNPSLFLLLIVTL